MLGDRAPLTAPFILRNKNMFKNNFKSAAVILTFFSTGCLSRGCSPNMQIDASTSAHTFTFKNSCNEPIWVGSFGQKGTPSLNSGGWELAAKGNSGDTFTIQVPVANSGRIWARTGCTFDANGLCKSGVNCCKTGGCLVSDNKTFGLKCTQTGVPPASLIEWTLDATSGYGPIDYYDSSMVDGWSVPTRMYPDSNFNPDPDPGMDSNFWCTSSGCGAVKPSCPKGYEVTDSPNSCYSPCQVATNMGQEETKYCCSCSMTDPITCPDPKCSGGYGCTPYHTPPYPADMVCDPWSSDLSRTWDDNSKSYISTVHQTCPNVYAWQFDDSNSTYHCRKTNGLVNYTIEFCPSNK